MALKILLLITIIISRREEENGSCGKESESFLKKPRLATDECTRACTRAFVVGRCQEDFVFPVAAPQIA